MVSDTDDAMLITNKGQAIRIPMKGISVIGRNTMGVTLFKLDNALCTPHTAWLEQHTYELYFGEAFDNILAFLSGKPTGIVNPDALKR